MVPANYTYTNGRFTEDDLDAQFIRTPGGSSPPPPYDSALIGAPGLVYHPLYQVPPVSAPYPQASSSPPPIHTQMASQAHPTAHPLPLPAWAEPAMSTLPSPVPNSPPQQTQKSNTFAASANVNDAWTLEQDPFISRLVKDEYNSQQESALAPEEAFHVKGEVDEVAKRLAQLRVGRKAWSEEQLKQALTNVVHNFDALFEQELTQTSGDNDTMTDHCEQLAYARRAARLELDEMKRDGELASKMERKLLDIHKDRSGQSEAAKMADDDWDAVDDSKDVGEDFELV